VKQLSQENCIKNTEAVAMSTEQKSAIKSRTPDKYELYFQRNRLSRREAYLVEMFKKIIFLSYKL
jgi:hypothetical protein